MDFQDKRAIYLNLAACFVAGFLLFAAVGARAAENSTAGATAPTPAQSTGLGPQATKKHPHKKNATEKVQTTTTSSTAATTASNSALQSSPLKSSQMEQKKMWSMGLSLSRATSLYDHKDSSKSDSTDLNAKLLLSLTPEWRASASQSYSQDMINTESADIGDFSMGLARKKQDLGKYLTWSPGFSLLFPTSKQSRVVSSLLVGTGASLSLAVKPEFLPPSLNVGLAIGLTRLFHQYEETTAGPINTQWSARQSFSVSYEQGRFSASVEVIHRNTQSYQGVPREGFEHAEEIAYQINDFFSAAIGHSLAGSVYRPNGQDSNVALMNENESVIYGSLGVSY